MRTLYVFALVTSLVVVTGCSTTGTDCGGGGLWNSWCNRGDSSGGDCSGGDCSGGDCSGGDCAGGKGSFRNGFQLPGFQNRGSEDCASGNCGSGKEANFSDYNFDCGPMCGAYLSEDQCSDNPVDCKNCQMGSSYAKSADVKGHLSRMLGGKTIRMPKFNAGAAGELCRGLGQKVGCFGCRDCGGGSGGGTAIGLNNSEIAGPACKGNRFCKCRGCLSRLTARKTGSAHPYGGELPHTAAANSAEGAASGFGGGGSAPSFAYPYYTTRGPRDFLQDGCGPPPIYPSNPRPNCLPTIGG